MTLMGYWLWKRQKDRFLGFLFGAAIGESLTAPTTMLPEIEMLLHGDDASSRRIELHPLNNRVLGSWSIPTLQLLSSCQALIGMKESSTDGKKFFDHDFLNARYLEAVDKLWVELPGNLRKQQISLDCGPELALLKVAPAIFLSRHSYMNCHQMITLAIRIASLSCDRPVDIFPAVELILLLESILTQSTVPDVYDELKISMQRSRFRYQYHFDEYEKYRLNPLNEQEFGSGLWLWKSVNETLGIFPGKKWADVPEFLPGLLKVKKESRCPEVAGALAGIILGLCSKYDGILVELVKNLRHAKIIEELGKQCLDKFVQRGMFIGERKFWFKKVSKSENESIEYSIEEPFLMYQSAGELRCAFITIVVKNEALKAKYPGGIEAYARKFHARFNDRITVTCSMGEIDDNISALKKHDVSADECVMVDFTDYSLMNSVAEFLPETVKLTEPYEIDMGVKWLKAWADKGQFYVEYIGGDAENKSV